MEERIELQLPGTGGMRKEWVANQWVQNFSYIRWISSVEILYNIMPIDKNNLHFYNLLRG